MRLVRTVSETAQYVEAKLYEIQQIKDEVQRRDEFDKVMERAGITNQSLQRELWMSVEIGDLERPKKRR